MKSTFGKLHHYLKWAAGWKGRLLVTFLVILLSSLLFATPAAAAVSISPYSLSDGQVDVTYPTTTLTVSGGTGPNYTWSYWGEFPAGLIFTAGTGTSATISGTPTLAGDYTFWVKVVDDTTTDTDTITYHITISGEPIIFTTTTLSGAVEGSIYSKYLIVSGGTSPYTFSLTSGALPSGLTLDATNGIILGTPSNGSAGTYVFTITATDSSIPHLSAQQSYSLVVESGYYESVIRIGVSLTAGETRVYFDGVHVTTLGGGETLTRSFVTGDEPVITVDSTVSSPTRSDVRYIADEDEIVVDELNPDATFNYTTECYIDLKTNPPQITTLTGAGWFKVGEFIEATAPTQIDESTDTQYRFVYWLLPDGDEDVNEDLDWKVTSPGKATATYDTYYLLTVTSLQGEADGGGWYEAGTAADWSVEPPEVSMSGLLGFLGGKLEPASASGDEIMNAPKTISVSWSSNYTMPVVYISLFVLALIVAVIIVYRRSRPPKPQPAAAAAAPSPPTIVLIDGKLGPGTTKEQLVDQFKQLLQTYEDEVGSTSKGEGFPEAKLITAAPGVAPAKEEAVCGHTSKKLLRTVVGKWHKTEEEIVPPDEKTSTKGVSIKTIWARDIYKEWEVSVCSLPQGHSGDHHSTTTKGYTIQDSVTEELSYSAKQKTTPPKPHFTDELPVVDVAPHQIIPSDQDTPDDEAITPDEILPPDQAEED